MAKGLANFVTWKSMYLKCQFRTKPARAWVKHMFFLFVLRGDVWSHLKMKTGRNTTCQTYKNMQTSKQMSNPKKRKYKSANTETRET
jgi:hypothetical protein